MKYVKGPWKILNSFGIIALVCSDPEINAITQWDSVEIPEKLKAQFAATIELLAAAPDLYLNLLNVVESAEKMLGTHNVMAIGQADFEMAKNLIRKLDLK